MFYLVLILLAAFLFIAEGVGLNLLTLWNALPLIIALIIYIYCRKSGRRVYAAYGFLIGSMLLSGYIHLAWMFDWGGTKTGASTSGLIFLFIPIYSVIAGVIGWAIALGLSYRGSRLLVLLGFILGIGYIGYQLFSAIKLAPKIERITKMEDPELSALLDGDPDRDSRYVLGAIASNRQASAETLMKIASRNDESLHEEYSCQFIVDLCGDNKDGRAVMVKVAYHPSLGAESLPLLAKSSNPYVLEGVAANRNATVEVLESIYQRRLEMRQRIETALAINEASPQSILQKLADDPKAFGRTLKAIVKNPSVKDDLKKRTVDRINRCDYEIVDYPFTKCVPNSASRQSIEQPVAKRTTRSSSSCYYDYKAERYKDALESCRHEAKQGKAHAQYNLAHLYRTGNGGVQDKAKAVKYYQSAADQNYGEAQFSLGIMYFQGSGIGKDMEKSRYWWERSAQNGISISRVKKALNRIPR